MTKQEALDFLNKRYDEQVRKFPKLDRRIGRKLYVTRNLRAAMKLSSLPLAPAD